MSDKTRPKLRVQTKTNFKYDTRFDYANKAAILKKPYDNKSPINFVVVTQGAGLVS